MPALVRNNAPRGPRFYEDAGKLMFVRVIDASTREGPREATDEDRAAHPQAWAAFEAQVDDDIPGSRPPVSFKDPEGGRPRPSAPRRRGERL